MRNGKTRDELRQFHIERRLKIKQLKWFGYIVQMGKDRKPRKKTEARSEARRTIERPNKLT